VEVERPASAPKHAVEVAVNDCDLEPSHDAVEDDDYELGEEEPVLPPASLAYLLDPPADQAEVDTDLDNDPFDDIDVCEEEDYYEAEIDETEPAHEPEPVERGPLPQRFTWESPERWWENDRSNEAA
jgi:hypothetical protein